MVEVENAQVGLPAVDARVRKEKRADDLENGGTLRCLPRHDRANVGFTILGIVTARTCSIAGATDVLKSVARCATDVELGVWPRLLAG
jgi:hypothetical protein